MVAVGIKCLFGEVMIGWYQVLVGEVMIRFARVALLLCGCYRSGVRS